MILTLLLSPNRKIQLSMDPFAQGGLRNVYRMKEGAKSIVAKVRSMYDKTTIRSISSLYMLFAP